MHNNVLEVALRKISFESNFYCNSKVVISIIPLFFSFHYSKFMYDCRMLVWVRFQ